MPTLLGPNGQPLRASRPAGSSGTGSWVYQSLTDRWTDATEDPDSAVLKSFEQIYRSQPVLSAVVDKLTRRLASLPFDPYTQLPEGEREPVEKSDGLATLFEHPWPRGSKVRLLAHIAQSLFLHANAVVVKVRSSGDDTLPDMLWPLDWGHIGAYAPDGGLIEWWSTTQFGGQERFIAAADVIHFAWPGPSGGEIGVSPLEKLGVTIRLEDAAQRYQTASFRNGNRPSLAVSLEMENPSDKLLEYARARVEAMHKGVDNNAKTIFTGANTKIQPLSMSPVEAALIEQRKLNREEIGMVYDLAGPLMNDLTHGTYSNVEELNRGLYRDVIPPWTALIEQTFQTQLLDQESDWFERFVSFDLTDKLKGDPVQLAQSLKLQVEAGLITRNEARRILNMPPAPEPEANMLTANVLNNQAALTSMSAQTPTPPTE